MPVSASSLRRGEQVMPGSQPSFWDYASSNWQRLLELAQEHLLVSVIALGFGTVLGISLGLLSFFVPRLRAVVLSTTAVILTIPSLALYALLLGIVGLGVLPVIIALTLYSLLPIVRNTVAGLDGVDPAIVEAAKGQGMSATMRLLRVRLPLAWPVILTGVRVSAVMIIGIATLGAIVNGPGLGSLILEGLRRVGTPVAVHMAIAGTLGVVLLGVLVDLMFILLARVTTLRGIRD